MEIKKKYIRLFEKSNMDKWETVNKYSIKHYFRISDELALDILVNFMQWVKQVEGDLNITNYQGELLPIDNIEGVSGSFYVSEKITSLKNLRVVGMDLYLNDCKEITELPSLIYVGGNIYINKSGVTKEYLVNKPDLLTKNNIID